MPNVPTGSSDINLVPVALSGNSVDSAKDISMIEEMMPSIQRERSDDEYKKATVRTALTGQRMSANPWQ